MDIVPILPYSFSPALIILCRIVICGQKGCDGAFQVGGVETRLTTDHMMIMKLPYLGYVVLRKNHFEYVILTGGGWGGLKNFADPVPLSTFQIPLGDGNSESDDSNYSVLRVCSGLIYEIIKETNK